MPIRLLMLALLACVIPACSSHLRERPLEPALRDIPSIAPLIDRAEELRLQVLITTIRPGPDAPIIERFAFRPDAEYFYPASAIKLGAAVAALERLRELRRQGFDIERSTPISFDPLFPGDQPQLIDDTNLASGRITLEHEIRKLCLVSDNRAFNRLFDFVGADALNRRLRDAGLRSAVITHRLSESRPIPDQRRTAAFRAANAAFPAATGTLALSNRGRPRLRVAEGFMRSDGSITGDGTDFTHRNGISLRDLHRLLIAIVHPGERIDELDLSLRDSDRRELLRAMTQYPRESPNPAYSGKEYPDEYVKFLLPGVRRVRPSSTPGERIEITNKIGQAYGFTVENAYLFNPGSRRAAFVTAVIYTNADGVLNDDRYEYATIAEPFMADLGEFVTRAFLGSPDASGSAATITP